MQKGFVIDDAELRNFCRQNHIHRLSIFGSVSRGTSRTDSDLDVLVEFEPGHTPGLRFFEIEEELSNLLGTRVDLNTRGFLSRYFRDQVEKEAVVRYVAPR
jgi:uncharacterized protein